MCKLVTFTVDRKTWETISVKIEDSNETIDYSALADAYLEKYLCSVGEDKPCTQ